MLMIPVIFVEYLPLCYAGGWCCTAAGGQRYDRESEEWNGSCKVNVKAGILCTEAVIYNLSHLCYLSVLRVSSVVH